MNMERKQKEQKHVHMGIFEYQETEDNTLL